MKRALIWTAVSTHAQTEDEKFSLPQQEADARALCEREGWQVIDVLRVPGHTRSAYSEYHKLAAAAEKKGIAAFYQLQAHWEAKDFDVLVIRDGDRLARSQGIMGTVVESVMRAGAKIYCFADGWVDQSNYLMWISMVGYRAAADIQRLKKFADIGATKRAERGLPTSPKPLFSHLVRRDEFGRPAKDARGIPLPMVVDESLRRLWENTAALLLEGVNLRALDIELYNRFGHVNEQGKPYPRNAIRYALLSPTFWGHSARYFSRHDDHKFGRWVYDDSLPPPEGVLLFRHTHDPVYVGLQAEQVRAELDRRKAIARGRTSSYRSGRFTGLIVCGECDYYVGYDRKKNRYIYLHCSTRNTLAYPERACTQTRGLTEAKVQIFVDSFLRRIVAASDVSAAFAAVSNARAPISQLDQVEAELVNVETQAQRLILKQASAPGALADMYDAEIKRLGERREILKIERERVYYAQQQYQRAEREEQRTVEELQGAGLDEFWEKSDREINQVLHRLLGWRRLVLMDGQMEERFTPAPPTRRY